MNGRVEGPIQATDVVLKSRAHVVGDIHHRTLKIERGAYFDGRFLARRFVTKVTSQHMARADELAWRRAANRGPSNRAWEWIVGAVFIIVIILTGYRLVQTQQHLETRQSDLENAKQAADQAKARATELAKRAASLNSELEKANAQRNELQTKLDQATSEITSAQSQLEDKQSRLGGMQSELEIAKRAADQGKARGAELAKRAASLNSELEKANVQRYMVDPGNAGRQSDLAASYVKVGDFLMAQGHLVQALNGTGTAWLSA